MPRTVIPDAIPYIDHARSVTGLIESDVHNGPWSTVPGPFVAAVSELESGDDPFGVEDSPDGAIGPMQVTPWGLEAAKWNDTGTAPHIGSADDLRPIQTNYNVGTYGLAYRHDVNAKNGIGNWFMAGVSYFGGTPTQDPSDLSTNEGDIYSNPVQYYNHLVAYTDRTFGKDVTDALVAGELDEGNGKSAYDPAWSKTGGTNASTGNGGLLGGLGDIGGGIVDGVTHAVGNVAGDVVKALFAAIGGVLPRIGVAVVGLGLVVIGGKALTS